MDNHNPLLNFILKTQHPNYIEHKALNPGISSFFHEQTRQKIVDPASNLKIKPQNNVSMPLHFSKEVTTLHI